MSKKLLFRLAALAFGLVLAFAAAIVLLLVSDRFDGGWGATAMVSSMDCSEGGICRHHPNEEQVLHDANGEPFTVRANSEGFRGAEPPPAEPDPTRFVVQLYGDSMFHGTGVDNEDTIAAQLQEVLQARMPEREVVVMNYGMPMNYLVSALRIYETWGRRYHPDAVVFEFVATAARDVNDLVRQIQSSAVMRVLFRFPLGRRLINRYQNLTVIRQSDPEDEIAVVQPGFSLLASDQAERGTAVYFFAFTDEFDRLPPFVPEGLTYETIPTGLRTWTAYETSEYAIPNDRHPNPTGTRFFAERMADAIAPEG